MMRASSLYQPGKILLLSFWRDESAVKAWRENARHQAAQAEGRSDVLASYRIRVAEVLRDRARTET